MRLLKDMMVVRIEMARRFILLLWEGVECRSLYILML